MADYNITLSDSVTVINIPEGAVSSAYSVPLVGQNATTYGDDVAAGFLRHLENFSAATAPQLNAFLGNPAVLKGQLWFDSANSVLNVNIGTTATPNFQQITATQKGATTNSMLRWDGTKWAEENQAQLTSAGVFSLWDTGLSDAVSFNHTGTDFDIDGTSTTSDLSFSNFSGNFEIRDGMELRVSGDPGNAQAIEFVPGDAAGVGLIRTVGVNRFRISGSINRFDVEGALGLEERASAPTDVATFGQVWVNSSDNGLYYTNEAGADTRLDVTAGGTVTGSGSNNRVAVWSGTNSLDSSAGFTWDGSNLSATNIGGIPEANLVNKNAVETISAQWTHTSAINMQANITFEDNDQLRFGNSNDVNIDFDATNFTIDASGAALTVYSGAPFFINATNLVVDNYDGESLRLQSNLNGVTQQTYIGFRDNANNLDASIGISSVTHNRLVIDGYGNGVDIEGTNSSTSIDVTDQIEFNSTQTALSTLAGGTWDAGVGAAVTSKMFVKDIDGVSRNVGWNETPTQNVGLGTYILNEDDVANFLTHEGNLGSVLIECPNRAQIPVGATWVIANDGVTAGTMTIDGGIGVTLYWLDGSGGGSVTGLRTLARQGVATIRKQSNTQYQIWGAGLT